MQQYIIYYESGLPVYRDGVRSGIYVIDKALTTLAFNGVENTDWMNIYNTQ